MRRVRRKAGAERPASPTGSPQGPDPRPGRSRARLNLLPVLALLLGAVSPFAAAPAEAQTGSVDAAYDVTFEGLWNLNSTPGGVAGGAHFTTLVGAVHNGNVTFWAAGGTATSGVEEVAEIGGTSAFKSEYNAVPAAHRKALIEAGGTGATGTSTFTIEASTTHSLVTLLSMIGPSPDWFVGVSGLSLRNSQGWQSRVSMDLFPYDAGTEDGTQFSLSNPATNPQGTITSIKGQGKFSNEPMARLTFVLQTSQPPPPPGDPPPGDPPPGDPPPDDDEDESTCTLVAPFWSGPTGGFTVRPEAGSNSVRVACDGRTTEYAAGENGLVTRLVRSSCPGGLRVEGASPGGWYWQHGERNAAAAPLVCSEALGGPPAVVPGGVAADATDDGTWFKHDTARLVGIVPHLAGNECGEYVTPYWQGRGGVVVRPAEGRETVRVRVQCGRTYSTMTPSAGEDGVIAELVRKDYCTDDEGEPRQGKLTVTGAAPGGWYWISGERNAAVAPLMCADLLGGPAAVDPGGVFSRATEDGTYFSHETDRLIGVVPHVASDRDGN